MRYVLTVILAFLMAGLCNAQALRDSIQPLPSRIEQIVITGNNRTRLFIVERELTFHKGDTLPVYILESAIERSRQNLMNTALFNFVEIRYFQGIGQNVVVHIQLTERWYLWPSPVFEIADRNINEWWQTKDFSRTNFGLFLRQENFTGRDDIAQAQALFGYTRRIGLFYSIPYINKKLNLGLSVGFYTTRLKETSYNTEGNKLQFFSDPESFVREEMQFYTRLTKRKGLYKYYNTTIDYKYSQVTDSVLKLNDKYFNNGLDYQQHIGISWNYRFDNRDYQPYALRGWLYEIEVNKTGLGLLKNEPDIWAIVLGVRHYRPIRKNLYWGSAIKTRLMQRRSVPLYNQRALGYSNDYIRGYDLYVMNGQDFVLFRNNVRYNLLTTRTYQVNFLKSDKFRKLPLSIFLTAFADAGYVNDPLFANQNPLNNTLQYGYGFSIDAVTYYDIVMRFEYAFNRVGDQGLYFRLGTVF